MARETGINVTLRWAKGDFVGGYVSTDLSEAHIELTEEQALKLYMELRKRFGQSNEALPTLPPMPEIPIGGPPCKPWQRPRYPREPKPDQITWGVGHGISNTGQGSAESQDLTVDELYSGNSDGGSDK